jgi:hypothetical protein
MKGKMIAILAFVSMGMLLRGDVPRTRSPYPEVVFSHNPEGSLSKDPPSNMEIAFQIRLQKTVGDFRLKGWLITFEVMRVGEGKNKRSILYRAVAIKPDSPSYAYWVYKEENTDRIVTVIVTEPWAVKTCPDGSDLNEMNCGQ